MAPRAKETQATVNAHESRDSWLRAATAELRPYFESCDYPLPEKIRYAVAFTSAGRKGSLQGETWHASEDGCFEIIIKADQFDAVEIIGILVHQLIHAALPPDAGHGKPFKDAMMKLGMIGAPRLCSPGPLLRRQLEEIAANLGPLPHAKLDIEENPLDRGKPADRRKKQKTHLLKAACEAEGCGYSVRVTSKWVKELGPPGCPKHGPMAVVQPKTAPADVPPVQGGAEMQETL
jgi:hypothetical protein